MKPRVIVALGATAAQALLGIRFRVTEQRGGRGRSAWAEAVIATVHPSAVLRAPADARERARRDFFDGPRAGRHVIWQGGASHEDASTWSWWSSRRLARRRVRRRAGPRGRGQRQPARASWSSRPPIPRPAAARRPCPDRREPTRGPRRAGRESPRQPRAGAPPTSTTRRPARAQRGWSRRHRSLRARQLAIADRRPTPSRRRSVAGAASAESPTAEPWRTPLTADDGHRGPPTRGTRPRTRPGRRREPAPRLGSATSAPAPSDIAEPPRHCPSAPRSGRMLQDSINCLRNSEGQRVTALVSDDLRAPDGRVLVPAGSPCPAHIARLRPARTRSAQDGELELRADSIAFSAARYAVHADVRPVPHELRGRGVTAGEAEKVAAGAVVGRRRGRRDHRKNQRRRDRRRRGCRGWSAWSPPRRRAATLSSPEDTA